MLNRYFDPNKDPDFVYANAALQNINYALISLEYIFNKERKYDIGVYHDEHTFYFYHIQNILTACGNLSNVFYNKSKWNKKEITQRCARLRERFGITESQFKLVFFKEVRNTNEHFDERYQKANCQLGDLNLLNNDTDKTMKSTIMEQYHLRTYDITKAIYYTYDRNGNPIEYNLYELYRELLKMRELLDNNEASNIAWVDKLPGELLIEKAE